MDPSTQIASLAATYSTLIQEHLALFFGFWVLSFATGAIVMRWLMSDRIRANEALLVSGLVRGNDAEAGADEKWREFEAKVAAQALQGEAAARQREDEARQLEAEARAAEMEAREEVDKLRLISIRLLAITQKSQTEIEQGKNEIEAHARKAGVAVTSLLRLSRNGEIPWPKGFVPVPIAWPVEERASRSAARGAG